MLLPILFAIIPTLYHYANNVQKLTLISLYRMLAINIVLAIFVYLVCLVFTHFRAIQAANAAFIFFIFFNVYGLLYKYLLNLDVIRIKHYTLLPLVFALAIYTIRFMLYLNHSNLMSFWKNLLVVVSLLAVFNLIRIGPVELKRWNDDGTALPPLQIVKENSINEKSPDIYYILMDEFEGFQGMREYWHYQGVDQFVNYLKKQGFFVAEASHGSSTDTLHQMASRLNYKEYPFDEQDLLIYFDEIADNEVMRFLKSRGYTTIVYDETNLGYPSAKSIQADYLYQYSSSSIPEGTTETYQLYLDEFGQLVMDNTMLYVVMERYKSNFLNPVVNRHSNMISFTIKNIANREIRSPKFVYVHLLLPHPPFIFNQDGSITDLDKFTNWNYYINNYIFSMKVVQAMVDQILLESDSENQPVIILQSDHGARNQLINDPKSATLQNYPEDLKTLIMFALYLPGFDYSRLPQDINPTNTFPIVFNDLFQTNIPLVK
jgi:hypothetical protein